MMSIIRTKREHNYTVISNKVYEKNQLSWQAMGLLGYLLTKPDNWQVMVADLVNVTKDTKKPTGREGIYNIINELKEKGFISVRKNSDGSTDYTVYDEPFQNPNQGKPNQAEPNQAEPTLVNTEYKQVLKDSKDGDVEGEFPKHLRAQNPSTSAATIFRFSTTGSLKTKKRLTQNFAAHKFQALRTNESKTR